MKSKKTKRALVSSALALVLCFVMLLGTTFAWFTDNASTSVNKVQAGTLDVALEMATAWDTDGKVTKWESAEDKTLDFIKATGHEGETVLWEPGCTYKLPELRIVNNGNLALKYKVVISGINGDAELNKAIDWTITSGTTTYDLSTEQKLAVGENKEFTISGKMKTDAGNTYQGLAIDGIAITVLATQDTVEYDSNNNEYDKDATYVAPWDGVTTTQVNESSDGKYHITNAAQFAGMMEVTGNSIYAGETIVLDCDIDFGGQTIKGIGSENCNFSGTFDGQGHTVSNFVIDSSNREYYAGLFNQVSHGGKIMNLTVKDATIKGKGLVGAIASSLNENSSIENCKAYNCTLIGTDQVGAVAGGVFETCSVTNCYAENCEIFYSDGTYQNTQNYILGYKGDKATDSSNTYSNVTVTKGSVTLVSSAAELAAALDKGGTIVLTKDINMNNAWTTPEVRNVTLTLEGNGHTITKLNAPLVNFYGGTCTVNNLTVADSAVVDNSGECLGSGVILNQAQWADLYMTNCHVKDTTLTVGRDTRSGALVGYWIGGGEIKNCTVDNVQITNNGGSVGGIVGHRQKQDVGGYVETAAITSCSVTNSTFKTTDSGWRVGTMIGTVSSGSFSISDCTSTGNTLTQENNDNPNHELYGRISDGGTLTENARAQS